jgi:hypothetical protein
MPLNLSRSRNEPRDPRLGKCSGMTFELDVAGSLGRGAIPRCRRQKSAGDCPCIQQIRRNLQGRSDSPAPEALPRSSLASSLVSCCGGGLVQSGSRLVGVRVGWPESSSGFKVASTLDGKSALPHRIEWLGLPTLPAKKIAKVEFLIDSRLRWVEHAAPYVYGGNQGSHRSYLVTSWLSPGAHHFTVRAVAVNGQTANRHGHRPRRSAA